MKKINLKFNLVFIILILSKTLYAQKDVTKFLGIPVDGSKTEFIKNLKSKGFTPLNINKDILTGEFNGTKVNIQIDTNNNKVSRIMVSDTNIMDEASIKIRFNNLCQQFMKNERYITLSEKNYYIPESEKISYEMTVNNKLYDAVFFQKPEIEENSIEEKSEIRTLILSRYSKEQIENPTDEIKKEIDDKIMSYLVEKTSKKVVWFRIFNYSLNQYFISIYYDNEYNRAIGEDL